MHRSIIRSGAPFMRVRLSRPRICAAEYLFVLLKRTVSTTSSPGSSGKSRIKLNKALSVPLPPTICPSAVTTAAVFWRMLSDTSLPSSADRSVVALWVLPCPSKKVTTSSCPLVIVPVLSLKSILRLPAVSIPLSLRTRTFSFNILPMF